MELSHPVVHIASPSDSLPPLNNKCYIMVLSNQNLMEQVEKVAKDLHQRPSLVIFLDFDNQTSLIKYGIHQEPWVKIVPGSRVISMTCSGDGIVRRGLLHDLTGSLGHIEDVCNMKNKEIRIVHNRLPPFLVVNKGYVDQTTLEASFLTTFLETFSLRPSFNFANQVWGNRNKSTGIWNGVVGLVGDKA